MFRPNKNLLKEVWYRFSMKDKVKEHYRKKSREVDRINRNFVFIMANENGKIRYRDIETTPQAIIETFILSIGAISWPARNKEINGFEKNEELSSKVFDEVFNPKKQIELRKRGISTGEEVFYKFLCYYSRESDTNGYLFRLSNSHLFSLNESGIEYKILKDGWS